MKIHGISGLSLLDYPGRMACTVFTGHCNFRCPFCHNAGLVLNPNSEPVIPDEQVFELLDKRKGRLEGVAITGGEPTLNADLEEFCSKVKERGLLVKLDTNGTNPSTVKRLVEAGLVDYIAMDIKAAPGNYAKAAGLASFDMEPIFSSVDIIMGYGAEKKTDYEFRTTVVGGIHDETDFEKIGKWIKGAKAYFLQGYRSSGEQIDADGLYTVPVETMEHYRDILLPNIPDTRLRGVV
jgi:pyruvate formate lyase activating enzyme